MDELLPIVIFAYNRPEHLKRTLNALIDSNLANRSIIYFFSDGAKNMIDEKAVAEVREVIKHTNGFIKKIERFHNQNIGLAKNIIDGVSEVLSIHKGVIVLEDDMVVNKSFLEFMNMAFDLYGSNEKVGVITGYSPPVDFSEYSYDVFFSTRSSTWGWAMSKANWDLINWDKEYYENIIKDSSFLEEFKRAGDDRKKILEGYIEGRLDIWGIRRGAWQVKNKKYTLYPKHSMLYNIGLDGTGSNCVPRSDGMINYHEEYIPTLFPDKIEVFEYTEKLLKEFYDVKICKTKRN